SATGGGGGTTGGGGGTTGGGGGTTGGGSGTGGGSTGVEQLFLRTTLDGGTNQAVYRAAPPTSAAALVSNGPLRTNGLGVSPDGTRIAVTYNGTSVDTLEVYPSTGGTALLSYTSTKPELSKPTLSPNNQRVAFLEGASNADAGFDVYVAPVTSTPAVQLASPPRAMNISALAPGAFAFSADSRYLAVQGDFSVNGTVELHVFDTLTSTRTAIIAPTASVTGSVGSFGWAGSNLVVRANLGGAGYRLHTCTTTGTCAPLVGPGSGGSVEAMSVSPDGTFVVYSSNERISGAWDLYRVAATGGTPMRLAPDSPTGWRVSGDPVVSPNGQWVAVQVSATSLYVLSTTSTAATLTPLYTPVAPVGVFDPAFNAASTQLLFRADLLRDGFYDLYRLADFVTPAPPVLVFDAAGGTIAQFASSY
ncbi:MAG: TolB family protein, partial [Myxococcota bacterium]